MKKRILALLLVLTLLVQLLPVLGGCTVRDTVQVMGISVTTLQELADAALSEDTEAPESGEQFVTAEDPEVTQTADTVDAHGYYYDAEHVVLYLDAYGHLPENYITKSDARALGWEGGSVEAYRAGAAIGGPLRQPRRASAGENRKNLYRMRHQHTRRRLTRSRASDFLERRAVFLYIQPLRVVYGTDRGRRHCHMELTYRIDCRELTSRAAAHDCFARVFSLPASYGRNLDALYDVLTDLPPCTLILEHIDCLYGTLGPYAEKLLDTFRDAALENKNIQIQEDAKTF